MDIPHRVSEWLGTAEIWYWPDLGVAVTFVVAPFLGFWLVRKYSDG